MSVFVMWLLLVLVSSNDFLLSLLFIFGIVFALTAANARISALEAELNAAREAWECSNAVKVAVEKVAKSAETNAKKLRKHFPTLIRSKSDESRL
jgi:hypothetical protein